MEEKISIIVPVYKIERYLLKCIDSVISQTYKNLEIILVDDGSPDGCGKICDEYEKKDSRIKVIHKENGGVSSARNAALDIADGDYIMFLDSDDYIEPEACEMLYKTAVQYNADVVVCGIKMRFLDGVTKFNDNDKIYKKDECIYAYIAEKIGTEVCGKLIKHELIGDIRFDENISYGEDVIFNFQIIKKVVCLVSVSDCLYNYNKCNMSAATAPYITEARILGYKNTKYIAEQSADNAEIADTATWWHVRATIAILKRIILCEEKELFDRYFNEIANEIVLYKKAILRLKRFSLKYKCGVLMLQYFRGLYVYLTRCLNNNS